MSVAGQPVVVIQALDAHVLVPVGTAGLTSRITPALALERSFGK